MKKFIFSLIILFLSTNLFSANSAKTQFEQGMEAYNSGNFASAELLLRKLQESDSGDYREKAWFYLALSIYNQKRYEDAVFEFNRFLTSCIDLELCSLARFWIAEIYFNQNDYIRSIQEFKRFISQAKDNAYIVKAYERIGRIYFIQQRYDEAVIEWEKSLNKCSDKNRQEQLRLNIGEAYFYNGKYNEAASYLKPLLEPNVQKIIRSMAILITGRSFQLQDKNKTALKLFEEIDETLVGEAPFNEVQYFKAVSQISLGNQGSAEVLLKSFIITGKDSAWIINAKFELAKIYLADKKEKESIELFEEVRKSANSGLRNKALLELAKLYFNEKTDLSINCLLEISADLPEQNKEVLVLLSKAYIKNNKLYEAEQILNRLLDEYSFDKDADSFYFLLGRIYLENDNFDKAINTFDRIKQTNPFSGYIDESYYYMGLAYKKNNKTDDAINLLTKYISIKKVENKYFAYVNLLELYSSKDDFKNSEKIANILLNYYSNNKDIDEAIYKYAKLLTDKKKGQEYYNIILNKFSDSASAGKILLNLGDDAFIKKDYTKAEEFYRQYLNVRWRKNASSVFLYRLISLERLGKHDKIIALLNTEENIPPLDEFTSKQVMLKAGKSYYETGYFEKALNSYSVWRINDLSESDILIILKCSLKLNDVTNALKALELIGNDRNIFANAMYEMGRYYEEKNDFFNSFNYFITVVREYSNSDYADHARIEIAGLYYKDERFDDAAQELDNVKNPELSNIKNSLLVLICFKSGKEKEATELTEKIFKNLASLPNGEEILRQNLFYHYKNMNVAEFGKYADELNKLPGNGIIINYFYGKFNFKRNNFKSAYSNFNKIAYAESEYREEALYYLGMISLYQNNNSRLAYQHLKQLTDNIDSRSEFVVKGRLLLAVIANEMGERDLSKDALNSLINKNDDRLTRIQAMNLNEYYEYSSQEKQ